MASFASQTRCLGPNPPCVRGEAYNIAASPDGDKLVYGSGSTVVIRDVANPSECEVYTEHKAAVSVAKYSPDGKLIASGDANGMLRVWDCVTKETKKEMPVLGGKITDLAWDGEGKRIVVGGATKGTNARVFIWNSGSAQGEIAGATKGVLSVDIRPTGPGRLLTASEDFKTRMYNGPPYKFNLSHSDHGNFVQSVRFSPDGSKFVTVSNDSRVFVYNAESGDKIGELPKEHKGSIYSCSWHSDSTRLLTSSGDKTIKLWDVGANKCLETMHVAAKPNVGDMQCACVFAGDQMISLSVNGSINYLDTKNPKKPSAVVVANTSTPTCIRADHINGTELVFSGSQTGEVVAYAPNGQGTLIAGDSHGAQIVGMAITKGAVYTVGWDDTLRSFDPATCVYGKKTVRLGVQPTGVAASVKHPDLVVVSTMTSVLLIRNFKVVCTLAVEEKYTPLCVSVSAGGTEVVVGGSDKAAHVYKVSKDKMTDTGVVYDGLQAAAVVVVHSTDGKHVAVGDKYKEITLWDRATAKPVVRNKWVFHTSTITDIGFSPDGQYMASTSVDSNVIVWNVAKPLAKTQLKLAHYQGSQSVTWLDNETIMTSGHDYCIRQWAPKLPK